MTHYNKIKYDHSDIYKSKTSFGINIFDKLHLFVSTLNPLLISVDTTFHSMIRISP
jgi:hypothetical protein